MHDLSKCPVVLTLSLKGRILVRHRFLEASGLFPQLKDKKRWLLATDEDFAHQIAKCNVTQYKSFVAKTKAKLAQAEARIEREQSAEGAAGAGKGTERRAKGAGKAEGGGEGGGGGGAKRRRRKPTQA